MKNLKQITGVILGIILIIGIRGNIMSTYQYERDIESYWSLAEKSSTIKQKAIYVDKFVMSLESSGLVGTYDAIFLETPDNSFDKNLEQLKTLQTRLYDIDTMDVQSFAYNTAIEQITAQEQGEAKKMLRIFEGCWNKAYYWYLWGWISTLVWLGWAIALVLWILWLIGKERLSGIFE
jgi:hypothetical protein